jgi:hypothetical protein
MGRLVDGLVSVDFFIAAYWNLTPESGFRGVALGAKDEQAMRG